MEAKIKKYIRSVMKSYNVFNENLEKELIISCLDEYHMQLSNGQNENSSFNYAISEVESIIKQMGPKKNIFSFSLIICIIFFYISIAEFLISVLFSSELDIYGAEMLIVSCALVVLLCYTVIGRRRRKWFNVVVISLLLLSWIITLGQIGIYAFHATMPDRYWSADYIFPCVIKIFTYITETIDPPNYVLFDQKIFISLNIVISLIELIIIGILYIREKKKGGSKI